MDLENYDSKKIDPKNQQSVAEAGQWLLERAGDLLAGLPPASAGKVRDTAQWLAKTYPQRFAFTDQITHQVNRTMRINDVEIDHVDDYMKGLNIIPMFRFCPYFDGGHIWGMIEGLKDPQEWTNKLYSQVEALLNQTSNGGWKIGGSTTPEAKRTLEMYGSTPGLVIDVSQYGGSVEKIEPNRVSDGHLTLADRGGDMMKGISGVSNALLGVDADNQESGKLNQLRQQQGLTVMEPVFDNFDWTMRLVGEAMVAMIREMDIYPPAEMAQVVSKEDMLDPQLVEQARQEVLGGLSSQLEAAGLPVPKQADPISLSLLRPEQAQAISQVDQMALMAMEEAARPMIERRAIELLSEQIGSWSFGRYAVEVTDNPHSPTMRLAQFDELKDMAAMGVPIPPSVLVSASGLPKALKEEITAGLAQAAAAPQQRVA
jgi:hypothetical protein